jgi:hypothetical protein
VLCNYRYVVTSGGTDNEHGWHGEDGKMLLRELGALRSGRGCVVSGVSQRPGLRLRGRDAASIIATCLELKKATQSALSNELSAIKCH